MMQDAEKEKNKSLAYIVIDEDERQDCKEYEDLLDATTRITDWRDQFFGTRPRPRI